MVSPSMAATAVPPSYPQSTTSGRGAGAGRGPLSHNGARTAPVPHFDSILRAAPAFDDDDDDGEGVQSGSSSMLSLPDQLDASAGASVLQSALRPHLDRHGSLHAYLDANSTLEETIYDTQEQVHIDAGKIKSASTRVTALEKKLDGLQLEGEKKAKMFWSPKRKRDWHRRLVEVKEELEPLRVALQKSEQHLHQDRDKLSRLQDELVEYEKVEACLDGIDNDVFGGHSYGHCDEDEMEEQYHVLVQTQRRLRSSVQLESRAQEHLARAHQLCLALIKELQVGLNIGIDIGVPTNTKHKTGLWRGTSTTYSARTSRNHVLRAKTLCGDLHTNYLLARAVQRRVAVLTKLQLIELNRLPGMNATNAVSEMGLHRSLEQSYAQAKVAKAHMEGQQRMSKGRQAEIKKRIKGLQGEARSAWLGLRRKRRDIVEKYRAEGRGGETRLVVGAGEELLPPYKQNLISGSIVGLDSSASPTEAGYGAIPLPRAFRRRVDQESMGKSKAIVREVAIEVGGLVEDDNVGVEESVDVDDADLPGFELSFQ